MNLVQHSPEWHEHRARHFNASEAGAVMGVNPWFPRNPADLFDLKTGAQSVTETPAMRRGTELEPQARAAAEAATGLVFTPTVLTRERYSASLDGIDFSDTVALEVKCPGEKSPLWDVTDADSLKATAPYYWWQLVHQQYVAGFSDVWFIVYSPERHVCFCVTAESLDADRDALLAAWERFGEALDKGERPETERTDAEWLAAAEDYMDAKRALDDATAALQQRLDDAKTRLLSLAGEATAKGGGVSVIRSTRKGSIDEKAAKAAGVDLSQFRKPDTTYFQVRS